MTSQWTMPGATVTEHTITVPLDWSTPNGRTINVFARVFCATDAPADRPFICFMQGGPGSDGPRPEQISGWLKLVLQRYNVVSLDQRGTGRSCGLDATRIIDEGDVDAQCAFMKHFRADSIVSDAEAMREHLGLTSWYVMGQSYGGFIISQYLSQAPEHLDGAISTGGLQIMDLYTGEDDSDVIPGEPLIDRLYRQTFRLTAARCQEYYQQFPDDELMIRRVAMHVDTTPEYLPSGERLTPNRWRQVGINLGREIGFQRLHYLCEQPFIDNADGTQRLRTQFLAAVQRTISFADNPLYALMHENIYARQGEAMQWSADRQRALIDGMEADADPTDISRPYYLTGEHIFRDVFRLDPALDGLLPVADALASDDTMPAMFDIDTLKDNTVPVAAMIYTKDMFVPAVFSRATAQMIGNCRLIENTEHHHDGIHRADDSVINDLLDAVER